MKLNIKMKDLIVTGPDISSEVYTCTSMHRPTMQEKTPPTVITPSWSPRIDVSQWQSTDATAVSIRICIMKINYNTEVSDMILQHLYTIVQLYCMNTHERSLEGLRIIRMLNMNWK